MVNYQTKIYEGIVVSNIDTTRNGILSVRIPDISDELCFVTYTSPFFVPNGGGIIAIPEVGCKILILQNLESGKFYYLTTIVEIPDNSQKGGLTDWNLIPDKYIYSERERPQKVNVTNQFGAGLKISRRFLPEYITSKVELVSETGKKISLSDSPKFDAVIIRNEHGDGIVITSDPSDIHSERSIETKSIGPQRYVVYKSDINMLVVDGRDITIENLSTGAGANTDTEGKFGNINLRSHNADINIVSRADDGRVFIVTPKARIQIEADGSIKITSDSDIQIAAKGDLDIKSDNAIRIQGNTLDIKANTNMKFESGGNISSKAAGTNSLDGPQAIHFNSGVSQAANAAQIEEAVKTDYNE